MELNKKTLYRAGITVLGNLTYAAGVNLMITPIHLYSGGFTGIAQLIRTFLLEFLHVPQIPGVDYMGVIYFLINLPFFLMAYRVMGRKFCITTLISIGMASLFLVLIPVPSTPIVSDKILASLVGGLGSGFGAGLVLRAGSSQGGQDLVGVCLAKTHPDFKVGVIGIIISVCIYTICLFMYDVETVLYSIIFAVATGVLIDKVHTQNIKIECMIFTKKEGLAEAILNELSRGVTVWEGAGAYTNESSHVLLTVISKYEEVHLREIIARVDPNAFMVITDNARVAGNFQKRFTD
ncbi:MAG: YitT family protein [Clostridiales bacterium]|nr:YitT family protein [Clostridiales bacterium]